MLIGWGGLFFCLGGVVGATFCDWFDVWVGRGCVLCVVLLFGCCLAWVRHVVWAASVSVAVVLFCRLGTSELRGVTFDWLAAMVLELLYGLRCVVCLVAFRVAFGVVCWCVFRVSCFAWSVGC